MRRLLALLVAAVALAAALAACSTPPNQPCYWHNGVRYTHLSSDGKTLLLVCHDGTVLVRHP